MSKSLEHLKEAEYVGVKELAEAAEHYLVSLGTSQEKGTVTDYPNERTVRYYISEGLLPPAYEKRGLSSVFGYEHVLGLLVIKKLQSDRLPISVIKTLIEGKTEPELEKLLGEEVHVFTNERDLDEYRRSIGHTDDSEVVDLRYPAVPPALSESRSFDVSAPAPPAEKNEAKEYLESLLLDRSRQKRESRPLFSVAAQPSRRTPSPQPDSWQRYEILPGVELHVSRRYRAKTNEDKETIIEAIKRILARWRT